MAGGAVNEEVPNQEYWDLGGQLQELRVLNRIVTWNGGQGLTYEVDPRHVEIVVEQLKLSEAKTVTTLGTEEEGITQPDNQDMFDDNDVSRCGALVARCNHLSPDRLDSSYAVRN